VKALVTRPEADAAEIAAELARRGIEPVLEPLLEIRPRASARLDLGGAQALLFTSANGVRAVAGKTTDRALPVFAVGEATGREARRLGWTQIESAGGEVEDLARLVRERLRPEAGPLVHAAGRDVAGDLRQLLEGFALRRAVLYDAEQAKAFSTRAATLLREGRIDFALFFSPRTAARFAALAPPLPARLDAATALCLSPAVAAALGGLGWREVAVAKRPSLENLVAALDVVLAGRHDPRAASRGDAMSEPAAPPPSERPAPEAPETAAPPPAAEMPAAEPATAAAAEPAPEPPRRSGGAGVWPVLALILVLALVAAAPFIAPALPWGPKPGQGVAPEAVEALEARLAAIENRAPAAPTLPPELGERIARLEERPAPALPEELAQRLQRLEERPAATGVPPELTQRLDQLAAGLQQLEQRPAGDPQAARSAAETASRLAAEIETLRGEVGALQCAAAAESAVDRTDQALLLALTQLRRAAESARPFATELGAAMALAGERAELRAALQPLEARAAAGVPTVTLLAQRFPETASAIVRAEQAPPSEALGDRILAKLRSLVSIRRVGEATVEGGAEAAVAAAEQALAEGDLGAAVAALETLEGEPAAAAQPWLDEARARLAVEDALGAAQARLLARFAGDGTR
jgi:uroporphyrinogen-III synthase